MAKASINFQKSKGHSYDHNFRKDEPNYLLKAEHRLENFYWQGERTAKEIFDDELSKAKRKGGRIPTFENSHWEAVVNLNKRHTLEDVRKLAEHIEQKFNITCATIAIHRDEGHYKNDKPQYNFHAHITFVTYKDGQQNWRREKIKPSDLRELQTKTAEILQMERGEIREKSERITSLNHRQYREVARQKEKLVNELEQKHNQEIQELKAEILTLKERNAILEQARKDSKGKGFLKSFFDMLSSIKKSEQQYTQDELLAEIERLKELDKQRREENERLQTEQQALVDEIAKYDLYTQNLKNEIINLNNENNAIKSENEKLKNIIAQALSFSKDTYTAFYHFLKKRVSSLLPASIIDRAEKVDKIIEENSKTQQRSNLTPLKPENHQEQKQEEQQSDEAKDKPQEQKNPRIHKK